MTTYEIGECVACRWVDIEEAGEAVLALLRQNSGHVLDALRTYETTRTAVDELDRAERVLAGLERERHYLEHAEVSRVASFLPVNQPLYALVLFGVVPALVSCRVGVRPSSLTARVTQQIFELVIPDALRPRLELVHRNREDFSREHASHAEVVIFTGTHSGAMAVMKHLTARTTLIFNGSGVNPVVVMPDTDVDAAAAGIVRASTYNSGQDCAAPKCVLVQERVADETVTALSTKLCDLRTGTLEEYDVDVGPLMREESIKLTSRFLTSHSHNIVSGGRIDYSRHLVEPTVVRRLLNRDFDFPELYSPVLNVASFGEFDTLKAFFNSDRYVRNAMYATVYGTLEAPIGITTILPGVTVLDHEDGNTEFGGYGTHASFVKSGSQRPQPGPVLTSRTLAHRNGFSG